MRVLLTGLLVASLVLAACGTKEGPAKPPAVTGEAKEAAVKPPAVTSQEITVPEIDLSVESSALVEELDVGPGTFDLEDELALVEVPVDIPLEDILKDISEPEVELPDISDIGP
jgi:hypothetical protein